MQFPAEFKKNMHALLGAEYVDFERAMNLPPLVSIRANNKTSLDFTFAVEQVKWCKSGFYFSSRPQFTLDPMLHAGAYYVQEASSMFLEQIVNQCFNDAKTVLDLCAAPGGKSTLLLNAMNKDSLLISNELMRNRANILNENITKWGNDNVIVTNNKPSDFKHLTAFFDVILADAPCSGEGMFRKDAQAIAEWSPQNVKMCAARQREICAKIWAALKPEGIFIYSTCTFNRAENEENTQWICENLGAEILKINISDFPEITETDSGYRFYPHKTKGEGFFISILRKNKNEENIFKVKLRNLKVQNIDIKRFEQIKLKKNDNIFFAEENCIKSCMFDFYPEFQFFEKNFKTLKSGLTLGEIKGKDFVPSHELAMSKLIDTEQINRIEVDAEIALKFLRKENVFWGNRPLGYILLTYKNVPLGWIKNLGNRANNLYINEWRVRMKSNDL
ncbi:MAG: RsmB/NOP family class I SAM-dependent RNA methyltransferase [Prevotellaceae bacterium]|jgi:16S rRNA C967 or C1407 C5-methylase (RsmB/RsmF family)/NOL1/NOP2/fmu family ribosome biogenesis protein|nr:RsmB/NOP family class I SAM-dependent RNA methyltransferase [Prevotellaceae bacterium]